MAGAASTTFSDVTNELKSVYPDGSLEPVVNLEASWRKSLKKDRNAGGASMSKQGTVTFEARLSESQNLSIIADGGDISPVSTTDPEVVQCTITPEMFFATVTVGLKTKWIAKDKTATFHEGGILGQRMEGATKSLGNLMDRVYAGAVRGRLGVVESDPGANQLKLAAPLGIILIKKKDPIDLYTALTSGSVRDSLSARRVTAINRSTRVITYSGADQTPVAGDHVFLASAYAQSPLGLPSIIDDGTNTTTYCGVTRSASPGINALILSNGGDLRPITEDLMMQLAEEPRHASGSYIDRIASNTGQGRMITRFAAADRRFMGVSAGDGAPSYAFGYKPQNLRFYAPGVDVSLEEHVNIQPRVMYGLNSGTFRLYNARDIGVLDDAPGMGMSLVPSTNGHKAQVICYVGACENQYNLQPGMNAALTDLVDPLCGDEVAN